MVANFWSTSFMVNAICNCWFGDKVLHERMKRIIRHFELTKNIRSPLSYSYSDGQSRYHQNIILSWSRLVSGSDEVETNWQWSISLDWLGWLLWMAIMFFKFEVFSEICFIQVALSTSSNSEALGTTLRLITLLETNLMTVLMKNKMVWRSNR